jgi:hypothetical protein
MCHQCRAGRNLFDLSHEVQEQLIVLAKIEEDLNKELEEYSKTPAKEWEDCFGAEYNDPILINLRKSTNTDLTPQIVFHELKRLTIENQKLQEMINAQVNYSGI